MKDFKLLYKTEVIDMKKWKAAGLITVAGACVIAIVWGLHGRTKNNAKLLQLDEQVRMILLYMLHWEIRLHMDIH